MKRSYAMFLIPTLFAAFMSNSPTARADVELDEGSHSVYGNMSFTEGGFSLGADYEYAYERTYGLGGYTRFYQKDDDGTVTKNGYFIFGAFLRPHFTRKNWDLYFAPGIAVINIDSVNSRVDDTTTLGPSFGIGLLYQVNGHVAVGVENLRHWVWFDEDFRGLNIDDFAIKARFTFN